MKSAIAALFLGSAGLLGAAGLPPNAMEPLPAGSIRPAGWLKYQLDLMTEGLCGRLYETSEYLTPTNGWRQADGVGWEEQPYWFRTFVKLAVLTENRRCLDVSREWVEKILATREADGWFGPRCLKEVRFSTGMVLSDIWGHEVMIDALMTWWEHSCDRRVLELVLGFFRYLDRVPDGEFIRPEPLKPCEDFTWRYNVQCERAGDLLPTLYRLYERTGDASLLRLCHRLMKKCLRPEPMWLDSHTVDFSQRFRYWTVYSRLTGNPGDRASADYWYDLHMQMWGQMPRGAFAADELVRDGCTDPREGTESCSWGELVRSFNALGDVLGAAKWGDRIEDVVFNHAPCAFTPDWKELHYLTAPNQTSLDATTDHNYCNRPPQIAYSSRLYRCCRHNASLTLPAFAECLVKAGKDGELVFWTYAPHAGRTVLNGNEVSWTLETRYPFRETAKLTVRTAKPLRLRFRVPGWARVFSVGRVPAAAGASWLEANAPTGASELEISMKADCTFTFWPRSGGVTVDRGPLSYSLALEEKYGRVRRPAWFGPGGSPVWVEKAIAVREKDMMTEVKTDTPWNYALDVTAPLEFRECAWTDDCFVATNAPCEIFASGRRLPEWTLQDGEPAALQPSPAFTTQKVERLRFVPLGCQRCRLSVLPQATDDPLLGHQWTIPPARTLRKDRPQRP